MISDSGDEAQSNEGTQNAGCTAGFEFSLSWIL